MHGSHDVRRERRLDKFSPSLTHPEVSAQQGLRCRGAETDDHVGFGHGYFSFKPRPACSNFREAWLLVNAPLPLPHPFEMFDYVGDVNEVAVNSCLHQHLIEQLPGWTHEWPALEVFVVA